MVLIAVTFKTNIVHAQAFRGRGPWCTAYFDGPGYACDFYSWEQCWATASGLSNQCLLNPFYVPPPRAVVRRPRTNLPCLQHAQNAWDVQNQAVEGA
jgi:hypothetical protein